MWPTSNGNRTLEAAEAQLVSSAILIMLDALQEHLAEDEDEDMLEMSGDLQVGISVYDSLTIPQRIATLHHIAKHLLTSIESHVDEPAAVEEAAIAAIYSEIQDQVTIEIGLHLNAPAVAQASDKVDSTADATRWRAMVLAAYRQVYSEPDDDADWMPPRSEFDSSVTAWEDLVESLASAVLWDRDFELIDGFLDEDPSAAKQRRKLLGIHDNYFVKPPLDPTPPQTRLLLAEARLFALRRHR